MPSTQLSNFYHWQVFIFTFWGKFLQCKPIQIGSDLIERFFLPPLRNLPQFRSRSCASCARGISTSLCGIFHGIRKQRGGGDEWVVVFAGHLVEFSVGLAADGAQAARSGSWPCSMAAILALTGSKSTNQDLKMACAMVSRVWLMWWLRAILSSSAPKIRPISICLSREGNRIVKRPSISLLRLARVDIEDIALTVLLNLLLRKNTAHILVR